MSIIEKQHTHCAAACSGRREAAPAGALSAASPAPSSRMSARSLSIRLEAAGQNIYHVNLTTGNPQYLLIDYQFSNLQALRYNY